MLSRAYEFVRNDVRNDGRKEEGKKLREERRHAMCHRASHNRRIALSLLLGAARRSAGEFDAWSERCNLNER
jgi:hypothetical protein